MIRTKSNGEKGLTAIELLIIASIVALVAVFATPMLSKAVFKTEIQEAVNVTESSIEHARETARFYKTDVLLRFGTAEGEPTNVVTLAIPGLQKDATLNEVTEEFLLPPGTQVFSERPTVRFSADGELEPPALNLVVFNQTKDKTQRLQIE